MNFDCIKQKSIMTNLGAYHKAGFGNGCTGAFSATAKGGATNTNKRQFFF